MESFSTNNNPTRHSTNTTYHLLFLLLSYSFPYSLTLHQFYIKTRVIHKLLYFFWAEGVLSKIFFFSLFFFLGSNIGFINMEAK